MPDIVDIHFHVGSGEEGVALYDKIHPQLMVIVESGKFPGLIVHTCAKTDDGVHIIDVWEDASQWQAMFADPDVAEKMKAAGVPEPEVEIRALHNIERGP